MDLEIIKPSNHIRAVLFLPYYSLTRAEREITGGLGSVRTNPPLQALGPRQATPQEKMRFNGKSTYCFDNCIGLGI